MTVRVMFEFAPAVSPRWTAYRRCVHCEFTPAVAANDHTEWDQDQWKFDMIVRRELSGDFE